MTTTDARVLTGTVTEVRPDGSLLVSVLGGTGMRVRAIGDMRAGDPVVLLQADKQWVALGGRWAASDHTHPGKATGEWSYSTNTTIADPGSGNLRFSADGLQLAISQTDNGGGDYLHVLSALAAEDTITMQETADAAKWAKYEVQGAAVDGGGWFTIDLALIESGGGGTPGNNRLVTVQFTYGVAGGDGGGGYVRRTGDTMTGGLTLPDVPTQDWSGVPTRSAHYWAHAGVNSSGSWDDIKEPGLHRYLKRGSDPGGPGGSAYFYVTNYTYTGTPGNTSNPRTQVGIPYSGLSTSRAVIRTFYQGAWSAWEAYSNAEMANGAFTVAGQGSPSYLTYNITFPSHRFNGTPAVVVTPGTGRVTPTVFNVTSTGFTAGFNNWSGGTSSTNTAQWIAIRYVYP